jgi:fibronectin-binding autotransporter adhesin
MINFYKSKKSFFTLKSIPLFLLLAFMGITDLYAQTIRYVKQDGTGTGTGWANASGDLQAMITASAANDEVWVAAGTYRPAANASFFMKEGVKIYGGFTAIGSPQFGSRDYAANSTILQGNGAQVVVNNGNGLTNNAVLNGFVITGGTTINNGGGMSNINSYPSVINCIFKNNIVSNWGGGIFNQGTGSTLVKNCLFYGNRAGGGGAAFDYAQASTRYINVTFGVNQSDQNGGALHTHDNSNSTATNCIFYGSTAGAGGAQAFSTSGSSITLNYSLINNTTQNVSGTFGGSNNVSGNPLFIDVGAGNYKILLSSPAIDTGSTGIFGNAASAKDLANNNRIYNSTAIDLGAYESNFATSSTIRYVKMDGDGDGDGTNWGNASGNLQAMINASAAGDEVWVAAGNYQLARGQYFIMKNGVKIYGGFANEGTPAFSQRDWHANETILSGDQETVVKNYADGLVLTSTAILDGFTITNGTGQQGGGIMNYRVSPSLFNLKVVNNYASLSGGGLWLYESSSILKNIEISNNTLGRADSSVTLRGGGIYAENCNTITGVNILVSKNSIYGNDTRGGGIYSLAAPLDLTNVTVTGNVAIQGSGIYYGASNSNFKNSILWNNDAYILGSDVTVANSIVSGSGGSANWNATLGGIDGGNNKDTDPMFANPVAGNFSLQVVSPALEAGNGAYYEDAAGDRDLSGNPRITGTTIDMGAYEQANPLLYRTNASGVLHVVKDAAGNGSSWNSGVGELGNALKFTKLINAITPNTVREIWVGKGIYKPMFRADDLNSNDAADVDNAFVMVGNVKVYGHFSGNETTLSERNLGNAANETVLSGDLSSDDEYSDIGQLTGGYTDNASHVVVCAGSGSPQLDGVTISGGYSGTGALLNVNGIGQIRGDAGSAVFVISSQPVMSNLIMKGNRSDNLATVWNENATSQFSNILITANTNEWGCPGFANIGSQNVSSVINATISKNFSDAYYSGIYTDEGTLNLKNSIVWDNTSINERAYTSMNGVYNYNNIIQGCLENDGYFPENFGENMGGNTDADPLFTNPDAGDFTLQQDSPAVESGNSAYYNDAATAKDLAGNARVTGNSIDMGVYELTNPVAYASDENGILYIVKGATGNGSSWSNAAGELAIALKQAKRLNDAVPGNVRQIWVAAGTYTPMYRADNLNSNTLADRNNAFVLVNDVKVYGNFAGTEAELSQRDTGNSANRTILSGDINNDDIYADNGLLTDNYSENAYHVIVSAGTGVPVLDGFTITGGNADDVYANIAVNGVTAIFGEVGGAMFIRNSQPEISNVIIKGNRGNGGTVSNYDADSKFYNTLITANYSESAAGFYNEGWGSRPALTNVTITKNHSERNGHGISSYNGIIDLKNSIVWGNISPENNAVFYDSNISSYYSIIQGAVSPEGIYYTDTAGADMGGNRSQDPLFTNPDTGDFTLQRNSPAIDAGNTAYYAGAATTKDLAGNPRVVGNSIDMGAYEQTNPLLYTPDQDGIMYVVKDANGNGSSWQNAIGELAEALKQAKLLNITTPGLVKKIWVTGGTYNPMYRPDNLYSDNITARENAFVLVNDVVVSGHFAGTEQSEDLRDMSIEENISILSGDLNNDDNYAADGSLTANYADNAEHVVMAAGAGEAHLDTFTIKGGYAQQGSYITVNGIAQISSISGSAMYIRDAQPVLSNLIIKGNIATLGTIWNQDSESKFYNILVAGNLDAAFINSGGNGIPVLTNVTISRNILSANESSVMNYNSGITQLKNSIVWGNTAGKPSDGRVRHYNNIVQGSIVNSTNFELFNDGSFNSQFGQDMGGNLDADPLFTNPAIGDYTLQAASPAGDAGSNANYPGVQQATDILGHLRVSGNFIDIGAVEQSDVLSYNTDDNGIIYVVKGADGNGASWSSPIGELALALKQAKILNDDIPGRVKEIWVAKGTYTPVYRADNIYRKNPVSRVNSFVLIDDIKMYGHFAGSETNLSQRDLSDPENETILTGDLNNNDTYATTGQLSGNYDDNAWHVVISSGNSSPILDGFTVTGGNANSHPNYSLITVNGEGDISGYKGSGIYINHSQPILSNIIFKGNRDTDGGTVCNIESASLFYNMLIRANTSSSSNSFYQKGAQGSPVLTNVTISKNISSYGNVTGYINDGGTMTIKNCILWGNSGYSNFRAYGSTTNNYNSVIEDFSDSNGNIYESYGNDLGGNLNTDPLFTDAVAGDFTLQPNSPARNAGNSSFFPASVSATDLAGNPRVSDVSVDMGAYEKPVAECSIATSWNGNSWSNGTPASLEYSATIAGDFNSTGNIIACSLTVNSGNVIVNAGHTFTIKGGVNVTDGASLTFNNNAALVQVDDTANSGNISLHKDSNTLYRLDYTLWSSPVSGQTVGGFSSFTNPNRYYEYAFDGNAEHYQTVPGNTVFGAAKGYLIRMPDSNGTPGYNEGRTPIAFTGAFTGTPHNGMVTVPASVQGNRYTAVGNPYPSPISVEDFFRANNGVINGSSGLYFWRKKNNSLASSYATLTLAAYTSNAGFAANPAEGGGAEQAVFFAGSESTWLISQGQGFFVQTAQAPTGTNVNFTNAMRRPSAGASQAFFRTGETTTSRYWLNLTDAAEGFSQVAIAYMDNATPGLDYGYDGRQFSDGGNVTLYSLAESTRLAIQARPGFSASDVVPMGFKAATAGQYSVTIDHKDGLFADGQDIYLKDNLLGLYHDLSESNYTFTSEAGTFDDRFEVVYTTTALGTNTPQLDANSVIVYKQGTTITINSGTAEMTGVTIYDIRGRNLYSKADINATITTVSGLQAEQQVLIVEVNTLKGKVSKRIVF